MTRSCGMIANYKTTPGALLEIVREMGGLRNKAAVLPLFRGATCSSAYPSPSQAFGRDPLWSDGHHMTERRCQCFRCPFSPDPSCSGLSALGSPNVTLTMERELATPRAFSGLANGSERKPGSRKGAAAAAGGLFSVIITGTNNTSSIRDTIDPVNCLHLTG
ncbi:hypothetical protein ASPBRDRAFT_562706 [Aspergillus brasiliensis CBS 101740]|uniref:Uncharacterized protein n=1 Tax=Aspergillus brasiliensis (strain CBS 101740 / IMI 381727 / IBT 21946) TaxID=767769 RepID=A0A1L9UMR6_ASPBC|nr:hypothetical protein ASPBRDRAFT_562706 [Aspergillus brasiliensis CBS 101740]